MFVDSGNVDEVEVLELAETAPRVLGLFLKVQLICENFFEILKEVVFDGSTKLFDQTHKSRPFG